MKDRESLFLFLFPLFVVLLGIFLCGIGYASHDNQLQAVGFGFVSVGTLISLVMYGWVIFSD